jgi:DNA-binding winged helix-turn-helix (wHTH) protein/predicted ATPase
MSPDRPGEPPAVRIEVENEWAWCGERRLDLTPRAFAVLRHLVEHPQRLITKDDLLAAVWRDTIVSDAALSTCIRDLREALGDSFDAPRYIQTVHRRGFRFIGPIAGRPGSAPSPRSGADAQRPSIGRRATPMLVGRETELARLRDRWGRAMDGQRQLIFVTGEPGIGKTALVEGFLAEIGDSQAGPRIGLGQCVEHYGVGEAYLPVLEALGRLGREVGGEQLVEILRRYAPTWLVQLPALLTDLDLEAVQRRAQGASRERMLREFVETVEVLSGDAPLVLVLEDLHWSDSATIDLLGMLARRHERARVLVLGTYRPADLAGRTHSLRSMKQELQLHGCCEELPLDFLSAPAVGEYLARRFPRHRFPPELAVVLHRNTDGNPLFVVNTIDYLIAQGQLRELDGQAWLSAPVEEIALGIPETLAQMVQTHVERLTADEQALLAVASVAGAEFSAAVAPVDGIVTRDAERLCEGLARRGHFLRATGLAEWPDATIAGRYAFIHALYRDVLYRRLYLGQRVGLHLRTGELLERSYGRQAGEIAGELAMHFEHGRDFERAVQYRRQAGEQALRRHGYHEAAEHATRALELLKAQPESQERTQQELMLQVMLGSALTAFKGHAGREVEQAYARARELYERVDETPRLFPVMRALRWFYLVRGPSDSAREVAERLATMAAATGDPAMLLATHNALGLVSFYRGEFEAALDHLDRGIALYDPTPLSPTRSPGFRTHQDPGVSCTTHAGSTLWMLGYPARAAARMREALALAHSIEHPFTLAHTHFFVAAFHLCRRERDAVKEHADACVALSTEHSFSAVLKAGAFHQGWVRAEEGGGEAGLAAMREWVAVCRDIRNAILIPAYLAFLAELYGKLGRPAEGLGLVQDALAAETDSGYRYWSAELHRLKGMLTHQAGREGASGKSGPRHGKSTRANSQGTAAGTLAEASAESCFLEALEIARRQRAKLFELRAAMSLSRLWVGQGRAGEARTLLSSAYAWFTEGFDTADLMEAKALLEEIESGASAKPPVASRHATRASTASP